MISPIITKSTRSLEEEPTANTRQLAVADQCAIGTSLRPAKHRRLPPAIRQQMINWDGRALEPPAAFARPRPGAPFTNRPPGTATASYPCMRGSPMEPMMQSALLRKCTATSPTPTGELLCRRSAKAPFSMMYPWGASIVPFLTQDLSVWACTAGHATTRSHYFLGPIFPRCMEGLGRQMKRGRKNQKDEQLARRHRVEAGTARADRCWLTVGVTIFTYRALHATAETPPQSLHAEKTQVAQFPNQRVAARPPHRRR
jgi:hypothetical protein